MKERPILFNAAMVRAVLNGTKTQTRRAVKGQPFQSEMGLACPYGQQGDQLWVRETYCFQHYENNMALVTYHADSEITGHQVTVNGEPKEKQGSHPSIHMPRWASRIQLEITGVRVERLQDISAKDIINEGAVLRAHDDAFGHNPVSAFDEKVYLDLRSLWAIGWESINGAGSWATNPWVWVVEFKVINHG